MYMCDFMMTGTMVTGMRLQKICSRGWQYTQIMPTGAVHSYVVLLVDSLIQRSPVGQSAIHIVKCSDNCTFIYHLQFRK